MSKILLTGASGFVAQHLKPVLLASGYQVRSAVRRAGPGTDDMSHVVGEIGPETDWAEALAGMDVVIHLAARVHILKDPARNPIEEYRKVNTRGTERLAREAAHAGVRRLIFLSTAKVNGEQTADTPFSEDDQPVPQDAYGRSKLEAELELWRLARETGMEIVIVRPPLVYGPGVKGNFLRMMEWVQRGLPLPLGSIRNRRSLLGARNLADLLLRCIEHPAAANQLFLASDGEDLSTPDLVRRLAAKMGKTARLFNVPPLILRCLGMPLAQNKALQRLVESLVIDSSKARRLLGWQQPFSVNQELADTAHWFQHRG